MLIVSRKYNPNLLISIRIEVRAQKIDEILEIFVETLKHFKDFISFLHPNPNPIRH